MSAGLFLLIGGVVLAVDPTTLNRMGMILVFVVLFLFGLCLSWALLLMLGERFLGEAGALSYRLGALRQSALLSAFGVWLLFSLKAEIFTWWGALLSFAFCLLIEFSVRSLFQLKR